MVFTVNCEKITYYIEKGFLTELNVSEKMQIKLHSVMCKSCRNYAPDSEALNKILAMLGKEGETSAMSAEDKEELKKAIQGL